MSKSALLWLLRRCVRAAMLLFAVSVFSFFLGHLAPGGFFDDLRLNPQISPETISRLETRYGIGQPFAVRYGSWIASALSGDFGASIAYQAPAASLVLPRAIDTLELTGSVALITWLLALPIGIFAASRPRTAFDLAASASATLLLALPELILALVVLSIVALSGLKTLMVSPFLPGLVLVAAGFPIVFRHTRTAVAESASEPYVRAARAHGIAGARLWLFYILPAAANPLLSLLGLWIGGLLGSSLLVETIFSRPGLGPLFLDSVLSRDLDIVTATMLISAAFLVTGNLFADLLLGVLDPRVRRAA